MDTNLTSAYSILAIIFALLEIIVSSSIIAVILLPFYFQKLHGALTIEGLCENDHTLTGPALPDESARPLLTVPLKRSGMQAVKNNMHEPNRRCQGKHHLMTETGIFFNEADLPYSGRIKYKAYGQCGRY